MRYDNRNTARILLFLVGVFSLCMVVYLWRRGGDPPIHESKELVVLAVCAYVIFVYIYFRMRSLYYEVDEKGITVGGMLGSCHHGWSEITEIVEMGRYYRVLSQKGNFFIRPMERVVASGKTMTLGGKRKPIDRLMQEIREHAPSIEVNKSKYTIQL